jgi:hypothetical protein
MAHQPSVAVSESPTPYKQRHSGVLPSKLVMARPCSQTAAMVTALLAHELESPYLLDNLQAPASLCAIGDRALMAALLAPHGRMHSRRSKQAHWRHADRDRHGYQQCSPLPSACRHRAVGVYRAVTQLSSITTAGRHRCAAPARCLLSNQLQAAVAGRWESCASCCRAST